MWHVLLGVSWHFWSVNKDAHQILQECEGEFWSEKQLKIVCANYINYYTGLCWEPSRRRKCNCTKVHWWCYQTTTFSQKIGRVSGHPWYGQRWRWRSQFSFGYGGDWKDGQRGGWYLWIWKGGGRWSSSSSEQWPTTKMKILAATAVVVMLVVLAWMKKNKSILLLEIKASGFSFYTVISLFVCLELQQ